MGQWIQLFTFNLKKPAPSHTLLYISPAWEQRTYIPHPALAEVAIPFWLCSEPDLWLFPLSCWV